MQIPAIRERMVSGLMNVAAELAEGVAAGLGRVPPPAMVAGIETCACIACRVGTLKGITMANGPGRRGTSQMRLADTWKLAKESVSAWIDDYAPSMGAALSYYTVFSLAPLLVIVIAVAGLVFGAEAAQGEIAGQLRSLLGDEGARSVEELLKSASQPSRGVTASIIGAHSDHRCDVCVRRTAERPRPYLARTSGTQQRPMEPGAIARAFVRHDPRDRVSPARVARRQRRARRHGQMVGEPLRRMGNPVTGAQPGGQPRDGHRPLCADLQIPPAREGRLVRRVGRRRSHLALVHDWQVRHRSVLGKSDVTSGFGAAGSIVLLLVWVYYSAQIFLLGAEFTWVFAHRVGSRAAHPEELEPISRPRRPAVDPRGRQIPTTTPSAAPIGSGPTAGRPVRTRHGMGRVALGAGIALVWRLADHLRGRRKT